MPDISSRIQEALMVRAILGAPTGARGLPYLDEREVRWQPFIARDLSVCEHELRNSFTARTHTLPLALQLAGPLAPRPEILLRTWVVEPGCRIWLSSCAAVRVVVVVLGALGQRGDVGRPCTRAEQGSRPIAVLRETRGSLVVV